QCWARLTKANVKDPLPATRWPMSNHERYRELSALAATGQLSSSEQMELDELLRDCIDCRGIYGEYVRVIHHHLPKAAAIRWRIKSATSLPVVDAEVRDRFLA